MKNKAGFTLLELILAITILSMVTLIIGSGFRLGVKAWEKGEAEAQETQRLRMLSGLISQNLKSAYPYKTEVEGRKVVLFEGDKNSVVFVTAITDSPRGSLKWVRYSYKDGILTFNEGMLPDKKFFDKVSEDGEVIDADIGEVTFEYFSLAEGTWKEAWAFGEDLPASVRVRIAYFQPFLIVIPMGSGGIENLEMRSRK